MEMKFLTTLLLTAVCFAQETFAQPEQTTIQGNILDDLIIKAEQAIEAIQSFVKQRIDDVITTFNGFKVQINDIGQVSIAEAKQNLSEVVTRAQKRIDVIKQKSGANGTDISPCLNGNEDSFGELFIKFLENEITCIINEVNGAIGYIDEAIQAALDDWNAVVDLPGKLEACGTGFSSFFCIDQLIVDIASLQVALAAKFALEEISVSAFVGGFEPTVEICAAAEAAKAGIEAAGIVAAVAACAC